jgi:two-component system cell cycle response regulator CtrA
MRILLADEDQTTARGVTLMLGANGAIIDRSQTGEEALDLVRHYDYDIAIINMLLPDMDGCDLVRRMRTLRIETPVLVLSSIYRAQINVKALAAGADDVLTKPFDAAELAARVQAIIRRSKGFSHSRLRIGNVELNLHSQEVLVDSAPVHLTGKEYAILELLVLRKGMVLTKDAFLNHLYGGIDEPEMKIIDVFICKLRKKLAAAGAGNLIGTVWGRGYTIRESALEVAASAASAGAASADHARAVSVA